MTATSTAFTGCDVVVRLDDDTGTLQDISGSSNKVDIQFDNKVGEFNVFGTHWPMRIVCGKDASLTITGIATTTANEIRDIVETWYFDTTGGARTVQIDSPASNSGDTRFSGEFILKSFKISPDSSSADPVMYEIELLPSGAITRSTIA